MGAGLGTKRDQPEMARSEGGVGSGIGEGGVSWKGMEFRKKLSLVRRWEPGSGERNQEREVVGTEEGSAC